MPLTLNTLASLSCRASLSFLSASTSVASQCGQTLAAISASPPQASHTLKRKRKSHCSPFLLAPSPSSSSNQPWQRLPKCSSTSPSAVLTPQKLLAKPQPGQSTCTNSVLALGLGVFTSGAHISQGLPA